MIDQRRRPRRRVPLYQQIVIDLRGRIDAGTYAVGDQLPSETELVELYGVSRMTARQAVATLRDEGLVIVEHGRGVFVAQPGPPQEPPPPPEPPTDVAMLIELRAIRVLLEQIVARPE